MPSPVSLRDDALAIWHAGVDAVRAERLMQQHVSRVGNQLIVGDDTLALTDSDRIVVVGAGKAGAGMAAGFETGVGDDLLPRIQGWVNVPDDCVRPLKAIHLHPARPPGLNEPTSAGVAGSEHILEIVSSLGPRDVCIVLLSGGGSALLPAPVDGVSLADKQELTRQLSRAGATIDELNCVRKHLSRIKGGRLAATCTAGRLITLIISDVIGDPLDVIASGPTVPDTTTPADALAVLDSFADRLSVPASIERHLQQAAAEHQPAASPDQIRRQYVIGNIDVALEAAATEARRRGYSVQSLGGANRGIAREVGVELADRCLQLSETDGGPTCLLSGGEPTVEVVPTDQPRQGGRNQELILAAIQHLWTTDVSRIALVSGGTDGEDGPTDAAGAFLDAALLTRAHSLNLAPASYLANNDSYTYLDHLNAHLKTGPTHTNVMDLRVGVMAGD